MRKVLALGLALISGSAMANLVELECEYSKAGKEVFLEIEQSFPTGSVFKNATLTITDGGAESGFRYTVTSRRSRGFNEIQYLGGGLRVEVDLWPDTTPQWGRIYRGTLTSSDMENNTISGMDCRFPNIF